MSKPAKRANLAIRLAAAAAGSGVHKMLGSISDILDRHCDSHSAADAECGDAASDGSAAHFVEQCNENPCTRGAYGVAQSDCPAIDIDPLRIEPELVENRETLRCEGLVDLSQIH